MSESTDQAARPRHCQELLDLPVVGEGRSGLAHGAAGDDAGATMFAAAGTTEPADVSAPQATNATSAVTNTTDMNQVCILI